MYLGGNGFYWKIALSPEKAGVIEIRRAEGGIRAWAAEVGEYYNAFDGEYGGLWRRNGRPPQKLAGVGFTAQGNFNGSYYRVLPEARDPRAAWMLDGIERRIDRRFRSCRATARPDSSSTAPTSGSARRAHAIVIARVGGPPAGCALGAGAGGAAHPPDDDRPASRRRS